MTWYWILFVAGYVFIACLLAHRVRHFSNSFWVMVQLGVLITVWPLLFFMQGIVSFLAET